MPVHEDGWCNKLQMRYYEALCGVVLGAQQIHLLASDRPLVVYTHISTSLACGCRSGDGGRAKRALTLAAARADREAAQGLRRNHREAKLVRIRSGLIQWLI